MSIRLTGMASGLDTESMITDLMSAYKGTKQKKVSTMTKYSWKMEAWSSLNKKINNFYSKALSNLRFSSSYSMKKTTASDSTKASVTASSGAVVGTQTLAVRQLAQSGYLTGGKMTKANAPSESVTASTTLKDLGYNLASTTISVAKGDGDYEQIYLDADSKISDVVDQFKEAGLNANFDEKNQRIFVNSKSTGLAGDFEIIGDDSNAIQALKKLGLFAGVSQGTGEYNTYQTWSQYDFTTKNPDGTLADEASRAVYDAELSKRVDSYKSIIADANDAIAAANETIADNQKLLNDSVDDQGNPVKGLNTRLAENAEYAAASAPAIAVYDKIQAGTALTDEEKAKFGLEGKTDEELHAVTQESLIKKALSDHVSDLKTQVNSATGEEKEALQARLDAANTAVTDYTAKLNAEKAIETAGKKITDSNAAIDDAKKYVTLDGEGIGNPTELLKSDTLDYLATKTETAKDMINDVYNADNGAVRIYGQDAQIYLNGALFESDTNGFEINGLTINVTGLTGLTEDAKGKSAEELTASDFNTITLTTGIDTDGIYNNVKSFITQYNELIKEMDTKYNAESSKDYDILSDEEKDAMSDTEVEAWDKKIRDSLLRRDDTLGNMIDTFKAAMQKTYEINGKSYSLSSFGIETMSYFLAADGEKGVYHIDGDKDDAETSANADKLRAMIASDPEAVQEFFSKLTSDMYTTLQGKSTSTVNSSYGSFYEDKYMKTQYTKYKTALSDFEKKLGDIEDKYYKQFSAMETALTKLQSSSSAITGLFSY